ncbi:MAG: phenylalanine--tRNA ligase subunit beta, partial [Amoebophilaceae bacterium]|nr:phenylalanine--tRNA ligase subunit beta [Amoebophilaceae bacterium]
VKIRGVLSEGMICAADEIGLGADHEGIIVLDTTLPAGTAAKACFKEEVDEILEIEITPNRGDGCSHIGIARELKAILNLTITLPSVEAFKTSSLACPLQIGAVNAELCPRYSGVVLKNIKIQPAPQWLRRRLENIGVKSINNVVDVTNFVLHELGQPLHAFDYEQIQGQAIKIKQLPPGSLFVGLDGITRTLTGQELMVCDGGGAIAMAGILGGLTTRIRDTTQDIFIESGYFNAATVRSAAQTHGLKTDASFRFERGTDPHITCFALKRAVLLLQAMMADVVVLDLVAYYPTVLPCATIPITYAKINRLLGTVIDPVLIKEIIGRLDIAIEAETDQGFTAKVPTYRVGVTTAVDLIEEIARIYGYDAIPIMGQPSATYLAPEGKIDHQYKIEQEVSQLLVAFGCCEIWTNSLIKADYVTQFDPTTAPGISILNPISLSNNLLRTSLLFSGLEVIAYNLAHRQNDLKLFEFGHTYFTDKATYNQEKKLSIWLTGQIEPTNWIRELGPVTLSSLRHIIEQITRKLGLLDISYKEATDPYYDQAVQVTYANQNIITFGSVKTAILAYFSIRQPVFFATIDWSAWMNLIRPSAVYKPMAKFPVVKRDLSLVIDHHLSFQSIKDFVMQKGDKKIQSMHLFNSYRGEQLPSDKKSYTISFMLQDNQRTLDEKSIDKIMDHLIHTFERDLHAIIRR